MATLLNRTLSFLVLVSYIFVAQRLGALVLMIKIVVPLLLALGCVWFPDAFGDFAGVVHFHRITTATPACLVRIMGWLILVGLPFLVWYLASAF
jgi:hypothetical protein